MTAYAAEEALYVLLLNMTILHCRLTFELHSAPYSFNTFRTEDQCLSESDSEQSLRDGSLPADTRAQHTAAG